MSVVDFEDDFQASTGSNTGFKFFSPNSPISQVDRDNFDYYKRNKYRKNR